MALTRRTFLGTAAFAGVWIGFSFAFTKHLDTLEVLINDLFPPIDETLNTQTMNVRAYIAYVLRHPYLTQEEVRSFQEGLRRFEKTAETVYATPYVKLPQSKRLEILDRIVNETAWGEDFFETVLTYVFEAFFGDPIYGVNTDEAGWKWVGFTPGLPRPRKVF